MRLLDAPVCVIVHRCPLAIANSMMIYSHNVSVAEWASVYEAYYASAMRACENVPTIVVRHEKMVAAPYETVKELLADAPLKAPAQPHWRVCKRKSAEAFATLLT